MQVPETVTRHPLLMALMAGLLLGGVLGAAWPVPAATAPADAEAVFALPDPANLRRFDEARFQAVRGAAIWGAVGDGAPGSEATRPTWRLAGIILRPDPAALVAAANDPKVTQVKIGAALPGGERLERVTRGGIEFQRDGCRMHRDLYATVDPNATAQCATAPGGP